jgi:hypothetical protein
MQSPVVELVNLELQYLRRTKEFVGDTDTHPVIESFDAEAKRKINIHVLEGLIFDANQVNKREQNFYRISRTGTVLLIGSTAATTSMAAISVAVGSAAGALASAGLTIVFGVSELLYRSTARRAKQQATAANSAANQIRPMRDLEREMQTAELQVEHEGVPPIDTLNPLCFWDDEQRCADLITQVVGAYGGTQRIFNTMGDPYLSPMSARKMMQRGISESELWRWKVGVAAVACQRHMDAALGRQELNRSAELDHMINTMKRLTGKPLDQPNAENVEMLRSLHEQFPTEFETLRTILIARQLRAQHDLWFLEPGYGSVALTDEWNRVTGEIREIGIDLDWCELGSFRSTY